MTVCFTPPLPVDLELTLAPLRRGAGDPTMRFATDGVWRATRTPEGAATLQLRRRGPSIEARSWGPGGDWALARAPALVGAGDDLSGFAPGHPVVARLHRRLPGLRITRSEAVAEALVASILEQKVTGAEARRSYRRLVLAHGAPAPGPADLALPPAPAVLARLPYHAFHPLGVERRRAETIRRACAAAHRLATLPAMAPADARRRLEALPGIGPWTAAEVGLVALGDADAVSVGDYHLPHQTAWALAGERRGSDARMLELLEPFAGHRGRVLRLIGAAGVHPPSRAPRRALRAIARM